MFKKIGSAVVAVAPLSAMAAVPAEVTTALNDMKADGVTVAIAVVVAGLVVFAIKFLRRAA